MPADEPPLAGADLVAFVPTSDPARSRRFYEKTLELSLTGQTDFACVYLVRNVELRVTRVERPAGAPYTVLGWRVPDIEATARWLESRGVPTVRYDGMDQDELGIWSSPDGARVLWFRDPDHNILSLTED